MGLLTQTSDEYQYYVDNIREAFMLIGQEAILYEVDGETLDMYWDPELYHKEGKPISLIFESKPKPILDRFSWRTESNETPYIAHIVAKADNGDPIEVRKHMLVELKSKYGLVEHKLFMVMNVAGSSIDPLTWICNLTPYRFKADIAPDVPGYQEQKDVKNKDTDFTYLRTNL